MKQSELAMIITLMLSPISYAKETVTMRATSAVWQDDSFLLPLGTRITDYWVSEKLDGIRAHWNGQQLQTRTGHVIHAPQWFTAGLPDDVLEGELWAGRGAFHLVSQTVLDASPNREQWEKIRFMVFDAPVYPGSFDERWRHVTTLVNASNHPYINIIEQRKLASIAMVKNWLAEIEADGGEGIMLHHASQPYVAGRSDSLVKIKRFEDAEAIVVGYEPGKGKYQGLMGALWVKMDALPPFKIGTGFSDADRAVPPEIGSIVTIRYNGFTHNQIPRFARYLRTRPSSTL
ncbi:DNA ligase [Photobacterium sp. 2_MG-2023]|uniref:DNA ligase n=1 Tax=Photobacterium TaxID=657 RepID=UPI0026E422ED|nr:MULTISPECIES: DNA ligase [Photobacterium]MDO6582118.1 DNA ligase [Photobacterium sp. 2_MG-2023]